MEQALTPVVEILGPWLLNKGDEMMLHSITERLGGRYALAASSSLGLDAFPRSAIPYEIKWSPTLSTFGETIGTRALAKSAALLRRGAALKLAPRSLLRSRGVVAGSDVAVLLDASGFCYGDQWPVKRLTERALYFERLKRRGARLIMLPQAFGPFRKAATRAAMEVVLQHFDLVFARDEVSLHHLRELRLGPARLRVAPDMTHLFSGLPPVDRDAWASRVCIVPNTRMVDKTDRATSANYFGLLVRSIRRFHQGGLEPVLLLHEQNDLALAEQVRDSVNIPVAIVDVAAPEAKGILGCCHSVVSSRYHALVSALSQATPALGTSWTHKYDALFEEYACSESLLLPLCGDAELEDKLMTLLDRESREKTRERLKKKACEQKERVQQMWLEVEQLLPSGNA